MSAAFVGDFSAAIALRILMAGRYTIAALGAVSLVAVRVLAGREIVRTAPLALGRLAAALGLIVLPGVLGMNPVFAVAPAKPPTSARKRGHGA